MKTTDLKHQQNWQQYFAKLRKKPHRPRTEMAVKLHQTSQSTSMKTAVDCGCGTGADTAYLADMGYTVHAFDSSNDAITICAKRFQDNKNVLVTKASFAEFTYPPCGIFMANASLYFAERNFVAQTWQRIIDSIEVGGIFVGDFLGDRDDWLVKPMPDFEQLLVFTKDEVKALFVQFEIIKFVERDEQGTTALGTDKHWHSFMVVARKNNF